MLLLAMLRLLYSYHKNIILSMMDKGSSFYCAYWTCYSCNENSSYVNHYTGCFLDCVVFVHVHYVFSSEWPVVIHSAENFILTTFPLVYLLYPFPQAFRGIVHIHYYYSRVFEFIYIQSTLM